MDADDALGRLERMGAAWARVDLTSERLAALDKQSLAIADNQQRSADGREGLKEVVRLFRATAVDERPGGNAPYAMRVRAVGWVGPWAISLRDSLGDSVRRAHVAVRTQTRPTPATHKVTPAGDLLIPLC